MLIRKSFALVTLLSVLAIGCGGDDAATKKEQKMHPRPRVKQPLNPQLTKVA